MKAGMDELRIIDDDVKEQMMSAFNGGLDANENQHKLAELNFEAWMRQLDAKVKIIVQVLCNFTYSSWAVGCKRCTYRIRLFHQVKNF